MEPLAVTRSISLDLPADRAWDAVLEGGWLGAAAELEPVIGATATVVEEGVVRRLVVTDVAPGSALRFVWWDEADPAIVSTVEVHVEGAGDDGAASTVTVVETAVVGGSVSLAGEASVADLGIAEATWDRRLRSLVGETALAPACA